MIDWSRDFLPMARALLFEGGASSYVTGPLIIDSGAGVLGPIFGLFNRQMRAVLLSCMFKT